MKWIIAICLSAVAVYVCGATLVRGEEMTVPENLIDFREGASAEWLVVNDGVMGGLSSSRIRPTDEGTGLFTGELSLENNGGFASVRCLADPRDLSEYDGLELRVRGDGRTYQLRLRTSGGFDGVAYRAFFETVEGEWTSTRLPFTDFVPTFRGRTLTDVPALDPSRIEQIAFMLADKRAGRFELEIEYVRTWAGEQD